MNKAKLNKRLNNLEAEAEKLRELINAPDVCEPEAGDVWESNTGNLCHVNTDSSAICRIITILSIKEELQAL